MAVQRTFQGMGIQRTFLGWKRAPLVSAVEYLRERYVRGREWDLSNAIIVMPASRASRRLLELLVHQADEKQLLFTPPQTVTEGKLPEQLYEPKRPFASVLVQQLTWLQALKKMSATALRPLVPHPPAADDQLRWLELAELFRKQHAEFAADTLDFNDVIRRAARWEGFTEGDRWKALAKLQDTYHRLLDAQNLWDAQTARRVAIDKKEPQTEREIILLGMVDMNTTLRRMLDLVAPQVTALIVAPESEAAHFDDYGCLIPESWQQLPLPVKEQQLVRVEGPAEQAGAVVDWLRELKGQYAANEIIVGVADEALVPHLQRELAMQELTSRWVEGKKVAESAPYKLLEVATRYAERRRFADLAACVRHPDVYEWLQKQKRVQFEVKELLTTLDLHYESRLSSWLDAADLAGDGEQDETARRMVALVETLEQLFRGWPTKPQPVGVWMQHAQQLLAAIYGDKFVDKFEAKGKYLLGCLEKVRDSLLELAELSPALQPTLTLVDAVVLALRPLEDEAIAPPADYSAIEMLGWLELPLDDAPALIVTTVNEGFVPGSSRTDAFLPDNLRRELGLQHDGRRCARDAYALQVLAHSRAALRLVSARRDTNKDPLAPSRLLFTGDPALVAQRALRWFSPPPPTPPRPNLLLPRNGKVPKHSRLPIPEPQPQDWTERVNEILKRITVTQFKAYMACPYRFYLGHVLCLEDRCDQATELDAMAFGNLIHDVLQVFGREEIRHSADPVKLRKYFDERLDAVAAQSCRPRHARAAVRVQIEQARIRLRAFADWQAQRTNDGWQIAYSEDFDKQLLVPWEVDGQAIGLRGRIDRIDYHPGERTLAILDYKTGDAGKRPDAVHRCKGEWVDLQLPLYRHLYKAIPTVAELDVREEGLELGYITLPKDPAGIGDRVAEWSAAELAEADQRAHEVIRSIRAGKFWPPAAEPPAWEDEFTAICQDRALGRALGGNVAAVEEPQ